MSRQDVGERTSAKGRNAPGKARPDGPRAAGRDEGTPQGVTKAPRKAGRAGCRTPGLLRGGRSPLDASACTDNLKLPTAWRA